VEDRSAGALGVQRLAFAVRRSAFGGAVAQSEHRSLLVQYMGNTFVFKGYVFLGAFDLTLKG
jgi:hypothetical protein